MDPITHKLVPGAAGFIPNQYVNDVFSVSYQYGETEYDKSSGTDVTAEFEGISAAYNIGPMAIKFTHNEGKNYNGTSGKNDENRELNLSMSF